MPCPRIRVVSSDAESSMFYISLTKAAAMFADGFLREKRDKSGNVIPDCAEYVPQEDRGRHVTNRGYDAAPAIGDDSGPHVYSVSVPAQFDIVDSHGLFASDSMPCHPVRWGFR